MANSSDFRDLELEVHYKETFDNTTVFSELLSIPNKTSMTYEESWLSSCYDNSYKTE